MRLFYGYIDGFAKIIAYREADKQAFLFDEIEVMLREGREGKRDVSATVKKIFAEVDGAESTPAVEEAKRLIKAGMEPMDIMDKTGLLVADVYAIKRKMALDGEIAPVDAKNKPVQVEEPRGEVSLMGMTKDDFAHPAPKNHRGGKRDAIIEMLKAGKKTGEIRAKLDVSYNYVYVIKKELEAGAEISPEAPAEADVVSERTDSSPYVAENTFDGVKKLKEMGWLAEGIAMNVKLPVEVIHKIFDCQNFEMFEDRFQGKIQP